MAQALATQAAAHGSRNAPPRGEVSLAQDLAPGPWRLPKRCVRVLQPHGGEEVWAVAFSPDGLRLATAAADGSARVWNTARVLQSGGRRRRDGAHDAASSMSLGEVQGEVQGQGDGEEEDSAAIELEVDLPTCCSPLRARASEWKGSVECGVCVRACVRVRARQAGCERIRPQPHGRAVSRSPPRPCWV